MNLSCDNVSNFFKILASVIKAPVYELIYEDPYKNQTIFTQLLLLPQNKFLQASKTAFINKAFTLVLLSIKFIYRVQKWSHLGRRTIIAN